MNRVSAGLVFALCVATFAPRPSAQLLNKEAPVIVGHYHLNVTSVAELANVFNDPEAIPALAAATDVADVQRILTLSEEEASR